MERCADRLRIAGLLGRIINPRHTHGFPSPVVTDTLPDLSTVDDDPTSLVRSRVRRHSVASACLPPSAVSGG
jgi:hypothetical protein